MSSEQRRMEAGRPACTGYFTLQGPPEARTSRLAVVVIKRR
jgi:hypothetical protein